MRYVLTLAVGICLGATGCWLFLWWLPLASRRPQDNFAFILMLLGLAFGAATIVLAATGHGFSYNKNGFGFGGGEEFTISPPLALLSATGALLLLGATLLLWQPPESQPQTGGRVNVAIQSK